MAARVKNALFNFIMFVFLLIGLALIFNGQIKDFIVGRTTDKHAIAAVSSKDIEQNNQKAASFDFDAVESLDLETIVKASNSDIGMDVIGGIAIPSVNLNLPIFKGLSNYALAVGAGTMKEEQVMGKGNYALASHHMNNPELLFSPLVDVDLGAAIFITDLSYVYEYRIVYKEYVAPTRIDVIEDQDDRRMITLVTCDTTGENRLIVQGELTRIVAKDYTTDAISQAFNMKKNN
ncbi:class A sortase [Vagococcus acidifermentans]|uniref:class A sortase n=1 Tax=Vagococcus acidifermentans TaxID=564710 RepID=UPI001B864C2B|nr:class A sortase [Vagococcus acidifermentans]